MKYILKTLALFLLLLTVNFGAQAKSYIYIQGDKVTPIYVKVEGKMMPRLGMNYCIVPQLGEGLTNFEILFQGNKYPAQKFKIYIPEDGSRSFVVAINEDKVMLYDINTQAYIEANNKVDNSYTSPIRSNSVAYTIQDGDKGKLPPLTKVSEGDKEEKLAWGFSTKKHNNDTATNSDKAKENVDRFLEELDMNENRNYKQEERKRRQEELKIKQEERRKINEEKLNNTEKNNEAVAPLENKNINISDCRGNGMNNLVFENIALTVAETSGDEAKLKMIRNNASTNCFTVQQVKILANEIESPSARFEVVKILYARTDDKENFLDVEQVFTSKFLKKKVQDLVNETK